MEQFFCAFVIQVCFFILIWAMFRSVRGDGGNAMQNGTQGDKSKSAG
jgi:hypothetical protein